MEFLLNLAGLFGLVILFGVPYLLVSHARLKTRVGRLEEALKEVSPHIAAPEQGPLSSPPADADKTAYTTAEQEPQPSVSQPKARPQAKRIVTPPDDVIENEGETPRAYVFRADKAAALGDWLRDNWALAVAGVSLALAGVFMVQYGVEKGLLTPFWRVMGALGLGTALIAGGEGIRRRYGDETQGTSQYLPSTLSGAGLVALFAGVMAAHVLYGLISPGTALAGLVIVCALAIVLGWFYGPFLAAGGIIGATAAPFLLDGQSDAPWLFYYYFALIALAGLAVDSVKRWAWVSAIVLLATVLASSILYLGGAGELHFLVFMPLVTGLALIVPERRIVPAHGGTSLLGAITGTRPFPEFPTRLAIAMVPATTVAGAYVASQAATADTVWLALFMLAILLVATTMWMRHASALEDLSLVPAAGLLTVIAHQALTNGPLYTAFQAMIERGPETAPPLTVTILTVLGAAGSLLVFWRMQQAVTQWENSAPAIIWALGAAAFGPAVVFTFEFLWAPAPVLGSYLWALHAIALAAAMTLLAERTAHGPDRAERRLRTALFAIAALTLIALALFLILTKTALTLALAVMLLGTALVDRRYDLPLLGWFIQTGAVVIGYRLVIDPGFIWAADDAPLMQVLLAYTGTLVLLTTTWFTLSHRADTATRVIVESAIWTIAAVFACVLLFRIFGENELGSHWGFGLLATVWFISSANQLYRLRAGHRVLRLIRIGLALIFGAIGAVFVLLQSTMANPLISGGETVSGPLVFDSLAVAYLPLALTFAVAAWKLEHLHRWLRATLVVISAGFASYYTGLEIRRFWQGDDLSVSGVTQPELYTYTVALLLVSVVLLFVAFSRRSDLLRKIAMAGVALTIAKVFLIDMSGLTGLIRVASFMGLGLGLAGLGWLDRIMTQQWQRGTPET
ncbi:hypothetical protein PEL8287_00655 [Roseovarius litorisediminis]|uniref:DUF2339 domain-containing protein n=1 Tax=Roseovarius litorisediminis TaxID=1312363 RepID=A0A1Y5RE86_9RHOB|nr:DUF2339 domain-containing protein [Roseovarius litorisediminis]SLN15400.1 hypothetical protein PEL8287_00655 [Roseovarius litorisediminis]